jgi:hypothetical protein
MSSSVLPLVQVQLNRYALPIILILGTIGNVFIVALFYKRRHHSCSMYLIWGAVMNSAFITLNISISLYAFDYEDPTIRFVPFCKVRAYLAHTSGQIARYLIVLVCADRLLLTSNYARFRVINRSSVIKWVIVIVFIFWNVSSIHIPILTTITNG